LLLRTEAREGARSLPGALPIFQDEALQFSHCASSILQKRACINLSPQAEFSTTDNTDRHGVRIRISVRSVLSVVKFPRLWFSLSPRGSGYRRVCPPRCPREDSA